MLYKVKNKNGKNDSINVKDETKVIKNNDPIIEEAKIKEAMKVVIAQGESIVVGSVGRIPCGEYTMESCDGEATFKVRIGRYVKEYSNGCQIVLTENQKLTPVSTSIILK